MLASTFSAQASQVVTVSPTPGDPIASGNALRAAVNGINDAGWGRRYLVQIEPGAYNLDNTPLVVKPWVDLAGSGTESTLVYGNGHDLASMGILAGLVRLGSNSELRDLSLRVYPAAGRNALVGVHLEGANARLSNLRIQAYGLEADYCAGVVARHSAPDIRDLSVSVRCSHNARGLVFQSPGMLTRPRLERVHVNARAEEPGAVSVALAFQEGAFPVSLAYSELIASSSGGAWAVRGFGMFGDALDDRVFEIRHSEMQARSDVFLATPIELPSLEYGEPGGPVPYRRIRVSFTGFGGGPTSGNVECIAVRDADIPQFLPESCPDVPAADNGRHVIIGTG